MIWRSLFRAGSMRVVKKVGKAMPVVGTAVVIGMTAYEVRKKGLVRGLVNTALDATPIVGAAKNAIEIFTGDWLPDKPEMSPPAEVADGSSQPKKRVSAEAEEV